MASKDQLEAAAHAAERRQDRISALEAERAQLAARVAGEKNADRKAALQDRVRQVDAQVDYFSGKAPAGRSATPKATA